MVHFFGFDLNCKRGIVAVLLLIAAAVIFATFKQVTTSPSSGNPTADIPSPQNGGSVIERSSLTPDNPFATLVGVDPDEGEPATALDPQLANGSLVTSHDSDSSDAGDVWQQQEWNSLNINEPEGSGVLTWPDTKLSEFDSDPHAASRRKHSAESAGTAKKVTVADSVPPLRQDEIGGDLEIAGHVYTSEGRPIEGQLITVSRRASGRRFVRSSISDRSGAFLIDELTAGDYLLRAEESTQYAGTSLILRAGQRSVTLSLPIRSIASLEGTVTDAFGTPLPGATVIPTDPNQTLRAGEDGQFIGQIHVAEGQGLFLRYRADGYLEQSRTFDARDWDDGQPLDASVRMRSAGLLDLTGIVLDESGQPVADALVRIGSRQRNFRLDTRTTTNGEFILQGILATNDVEINVSADRRFEPFVAANLNIDSDTMQQLQIVLRSATLGRMIATVYDVSGHPVPQLDFIAVASGRSGRVASLSSTVTGQLTLEDFTAGPVTLKSRTAPTIIVKGIDLVPGQDSWYPFTVDVGNHRLRGRVVDAEGFPVRGAQISMSQRHVSGELQATTTHATSSNSNGEFSFTGVGEGSRVIVVAAQDYKDATMVADPAVGEVEIRVSLHR